MATTRPTFTMQGASAGQEAKWVCRSLTDTESPSWMWQAYIHTPPLCHSNYQSIGTPLGGEGGEGGVIYCALVIYF